MSAALLGLDHPAPVPPPAHPLEEGLTAEFLALLTWDWTTRTISFPSEHPVLGSRTCMVASCEKPTTSTVGLCRSCFELWRRAGQPEVVQFAATTTRKRRRLPREPCTVAACQRPRETAGTGLCVAHSHQQRFLGLSIEQFCADARVHPHSSMGVCGVAACDWDRSGRGPYCRLHSDRRAIAKKADPDFDEDRWRRTAPPIAEGNRVSLLAVPDQIALELLYGLQARTEDGFRTDLDTLRLLVDRARLAEIGSLRELSDEALSAWTRPLRNSFLAALDRRGDNPVTNWSGDRWNLRSLGHTGILRFDSISQPWLREATKRWVHEQLPTRRGPRVGNIMKTHIGDMARFSSSLALHRGDRGQQAGALGRPDVVEFLNRLAYLESTEEISGLTRSRVCRCVDTMLRRMRSMGLTRPGEPLQDLPGDVALERSDIPTEDRDEPGRDLPAEVVTALIGALDILEGQASREVRTAAELMMDTGRRPSEITLLALDCLGRDADDKPVLIWDNAKELRYGRRLPISEATAQIIVTQQDRIRARFPDIPDSGLVLLPRAKRNPRGDHPITHSWVAAKHRAWVDSLPALAAATAVEVDGHTVTRSLPFAKNTITPYCWRHTYAQRHADAGVPVDVLRELLDHNSMTTTQRYYRVSQTRKRTAIDRVTSMQFDRHGDRLWRQTDTLLDSERARRGLGEVAVPYGLCTEPTNVAAGGGDCPVRFRCVGCSHFRTDVSYLPDLEAYLADLLRNRERLLACAADDWAITEAMPSEQEISRLRVLIGRVKTDLEDLDDTAHAEIAEAVTAVRRARHGVVGLGLPRARPHVPDLREEHTG